jgi:hypothetical protein
MVDIPESIEFGNVKKMTTKVVEFQFKNPVRRGMKYKLSVEKKWIDIFRLPNNLAELSVSNFDQVCFFSCVLLTI